MEKDADGCRGVREARGVFYRELPAALLAGLCYLPSDHRAKFRGGSSRGGYEIASLPSERARSPARSRAA